MTDVLYPGRVTIALPLYKRFEFLPATIASAMAQDYEDVEFLFSDNGENGPELEAFLDRHCTRPYRLRRNEWSIPLPAHLNQLIEEASGQYFVVLSDDDEITPGFVSGLVGALEGHPDARVAIPRVTTMDDNGVRRERRPDSVPPPPYMSDVAFIEAWCEGGHGFRCFLTTLARTGELRRVGGYPHLYKGNSIDNALLLKLILGGSVAYVDDEEFIYRVHDESHGLAVSYAELAKALNGFLDFLDADPVLAEYGKAEPRAWTRAREALRSMTWRTYRHRWKHRYGPRLTTYQWVKAAFALRFIPEYYQAAIGYMVRRGLSASKQRLVRTLAPDSGGAGQGGGGA